MVGGSVRLLHAIGVVAIRGVFKGPGGPVDPGALLAAIAHVTPSPELPEWANRAYGRPAKSRKLETAHHGYANTHSSDE